ncbi:MAG: M48 family metalloprotease [Candidatus Hodarchaeota archaeon]
MENTNCNNRLHVPFPTRLLLWLKLLLSKIACLAVVLTSLTLTGCATTTLQPLREEAERADLESDEVIVWREADHLEQVLSKYVLDFRGKQEAEQYIEQIIMLLAPGYCKHSENKIRITVLVDPERNAFILPNGALYVNTGLLSLIENEAHLATILGHEFSHFKNRHTIRQKRKAENTRNIGFIMGICLAGIAGTATGTIDYNLPTSVSSLWSMTAVSGYSRDLEREADYEGLQMTLKAGYSPDATTKVFKLLLDSIDSEDDKVSPFFSSHPKLQERITNYEEHLKLPEIKSLMTGTRIASEEYKRIILPIYLANANQLLKLEKYDAAKFDIERYLSVRSDDAEAYFLLGEVTRRHRNNPDALRLALDSYQKALQLDPKCIECYREIGLTFRYLGDGKEASKYLSKYLELDPQVPDAPIIRTYIQSQ